ncbi:hypothetical protein VP01_10057g1, partial [Puccinia sorghi]
GFYWLVLENPKFVWDLLYSCFIYHVLKMNAQWQSKGLDLHVFASEKFESYNGILRNASVHSNQHSPGRDIAIQFSNYQSITKKHFQPSPKVTEAFQNEKKNLKKIMGMNTTDTPNYPELKKPKIQEEEEIALPAGKKGWHPHE